ncbi:MAG: cobamide remodeling phosphodiesterase CbiR [Desulfomonilaceae bacterium]
MRLGTTSYIYPADIITNVRKLAGRVQDVELVIFELDEGSNDLPDKDTIDELKLLAADHDMTYTVHLPLGLGLADEEPSIAKAVRAIRSTEQLLPRAYIVHLETKDRSSPGLSRRWIDNSLRSLKIICDEVPRPEHVCVENLDDWSPTKLDAILDTIPVSCCVDIGHLWKQGLDPTPFLDKWSSRTRVVHIHGVSDRDHKRLSLIPATRLDPVVEMLHRHFQGVLTFEVFNERDLLDSLATFHQSVQRVGVSGQHHE